MWMDAIIAAGSDPQKDAELLAHAGGAPCKAMIELGGQTFLERIVSAMYASGRVRRIVVFGLPPEHQPDLGAQTTFLPDTGGLFDSGKASIQYLQSTGGASERILISSCDIPLLTPEILNAFVDQCLPYDVDLCYPIVRKETMEQAFPGSGRTFIPLAEGRFAGGDIHVIRPSLAHVDRSKMEEVIGQRKTFWKQLRAIGFGTLFLFLIHRLTIGQLERRVIKVLGITGKAIICPHAEVAMDADKPHHLAVIGSALAQRKPTG